MNASLKHTYISKQNYNKICKDLNVLISPLVVVGPAVVVVDNVVVDDAVVVGPAIIVVDTVVVGDSVVVGSSVLSHVSNLIDCAK